MRHLVRLVLPIGMLLLVVSSTDTFAQKITGDITGTVTDSTGGVLPGSP